MDFPSPIDLALTDIPQIPGRASTLLTTSWCGYLAVTLPAAIGQARSTDAAQSAGPALSQPEPRPHPISEAANRRVAFGCGAGQELEDVLHLRHNLQRHIDTGSARLVGEAAAVI